MMDDHSTILLTNSNDAAQNNGQPAQELKKSPISVQHAAMSAAALLVGGIGSYAIYNHLDTPSVAGNITPQTDDFLKNPPPQACNVTDDMNFNTAFTAARQEVGAGGFFVWRGKVYDTYYDDELAKMSQDQKDLYQHNVDEVHPHVPEYHNHTLSTDSSNVASQQTPIVQDTSLQPSSPTQIENTTNNLTSTEPVKPTDNPEQPTIVQNTPQNDTPDPGITPPTSNTTDVPTVTPVVNTVVAEETPQGQVIDIDGDDIPDGVVITGGEGEPTLLALDMNHNGVVDAVLVDADNNGQPDYYAIDANEDNIIDEAGAIVPGTDIQLVYQNNSQNNPDFDTYTNVEDWSDTNEQNVYTQADPDIDNNANMEDWSADV